MKILDNGQVEIRNKRTGATKVVDPKDLPNYGISYSTYQDELNAYDTITGSDTVEQKKKQAEEVSKKKTVADAAKGVLDVLNKTQSGEITGKEAEDALNYAASNYNSAVAFGTGGKSLTNTERTTFAGKLIDQTEQNANILQRIAGFITGEKPITKSKVSSDEQTIKNRVLSAIQDYVNAQSGNTDRLNTGSSLSDDEIMNLLK